MTKKVKRQKPLDTYEVHDVVIFQISNFKFALVQGETTQNLIFLKPQKWASKQILTPYLDRMWNRLSSIIAQKAVNPLPVLAHYLVGYSNQIGHFLDVGMSQVNAWQLCLAWLQVCLSI